MSITGLLDDIERLYPPERLARSRARLQCVWAGRGAPDRIPFVFTSLPAEQATPPPEPPEAEPSDEELLRGQLEAIIDRAALHDDYVPSLFPGCRQGTIPAAFGAREIVSGGHTWVEPILRDPADVDALGTPDWRLGAAGEMLERVRVWRAATSGRIPIQLPDMQGPLDLANNLWGTEPLLTAMYTAPDAVHRLMQYMTEAFIAYVRLVQQAAQGELIPIHCMPVVWMPPSIGVALSEDLLAVISPRLYDLFGRPYNEQIARAYGSVVVHSCGSIEHNLPGLLDTEGLLGVNASITETSLAALVRVLGRRAVILPHLAEATCNGLPQLTPEAHLRLCIESFGAANSRGIIISIPLGLSRQDTLELADLACVLARSS